MHLYLLFVQFHKKINLQVLLIFLISKLRIIKWKWENGGDLDNVKKIVRHLYHKTKDLVRQSKHFEKVKK